MSMNFLSHYQKKIESIAKRNSVSYLALFGSYAREDHKPTSDVDFLVEFNKPVGLIHLIRTEHQLEDILKKKVDLITRKGLSKYLRPFVEPDLKVIYEAN
ncbi:hypothetical protein COW80_04680 [Candidatus Beckwithbacteria bacterium CG22_combo_CG10-13_8_21_14_all_01_47_9]|uniref:Polymerase nucleotidyl transferase domain-containing protein n=3 Tax=Candidatus Beckwithiibacteriota TaxID=1752726 RepID=A0A2H0E123_9BACT|nr:MAG: hypothetical protein COX09_00580 [Candidatus Beckwithbacteria bacterium CG23_combo_of_CG06-09_8_20_14_all_47_9]PIP87649.1 MAG: hypothetical protein COW80_04680 [Candidatus Beckwithbacteria bacterium CG22_combo_CG10-13_8_21_14_all_01_47_9]PJA23416.1 MAG: hypothetical protein COX59_00030 [Candidatus Beckwithbacteria bacterium CG_4_10_14_0_2_um_filter_47_25]